MLGFDVECLPLSLLLSRPAKFYCGVYVFVHCPVSVFSLSEAVRDLRAVSAPSPVVVVVSSSSFVDRILLLESGADDVMSIPYEFDELVARLRSLLRRCEGSGDIKTSSCLSIKDLVVNRESREVFRGDIVVRLTVKEHDLLAYLMRHRGRVCARKDILYAVWGDTWVGDDNLLDVYIRYLRKKIERPDLEPLIHTIRGVGFMLK